MNHVSFCAPPGAARIGPTLGIAAELVRRGRRVSFAATRKAATAVTDAGGILIEYDTSLDEDDNDVPRFSALLREAKLVLPALTQRYAAYVPDLVVYDATMAWWGRLLAAHWSVPSIPVWPGFVPREHPAVRSGPLTRRRGIAKLAGELGLTPEEVLLGRGTPAQLALLPKALQEGADSFDHSYQFVGPVEPPSTRKPPRGTLPPAVPSTGLPLIVTSARLQRRCGEAFNGRNSHAVAPVGNRVSQEALQHAVAFVSDGELHHTLSALRAGVPLVLVPRTPEQRHVAARVTELGLGAQLEPREASGNRLREAVLGVCADEDIAVNLRAMRHRIERSGGVTAAATIVEGVLAAQSAHPVPRRLPGNRLDSARGPR